MASSEPGLRGESAEGARCLECAVCLLEWLCVFVAPCKLEASSEHTAHVVCLCVPCNLEASISVVTGVLLVTSHCCSSCGMPLLPAVGFDRNRSNTLHTTRWEATCTMTQSEKP